MIIKLYKNNSENNRIGKSLVQKAQKDCVLKQNCSILSPEIELTFEEGTMQDINYMYIPQFGRYYFIDNIETLIGERYRIKASVDVLESYKTDILDVDCIINETFDTGKDKYLSSNNWVANVKNKTDIINFPNGLLQNGEFILITAGG